jgi:hypothetical protein
MKRDMMIKIIHCSNKKRKDDTNHQSEDEKD